MPFTQVVELLGPVSHSLMKTPDELSVLYGVSVKVASGAIALNRQVEHEKLPLRHLLCCKYAANFVRACRTEFSTELSNAATVEYDFDHDGNPVFGLLPFAPLSWSTVEASATPMGRVSNGCSKTHSLRRPIA